MGGNAALGVSLALALNVMTALAHPAEAPGIESLRPPHLSGYKTFFADPVMGIRGEVAILRPPPET